MRPLPTTFKGRGPQKGFTFSQVTRNERFAVYHKTKGPDKTPSWEVIRIQKNKERSMGGAPIPAMESFPSPESWGTQGWTHINEKGALDRFNQLSLSMES